MAATMSRLQPLLRQTGMRLATGPSARRCFSISTPRNIVYGFIGLGRMGYPMAKNLRAKIGSTEELIVNDINTDAAKQFVSELEDNKYTSFEEDVKTVAKKSDTIITVLPEPSHVRSVYEAILECPDLPASSNSGATRLFIDCSTIDPVTSREMAKATTTTGAGAFVDAPMSGGVVGAQAGGLTFMVGCPEALVSRTQKVLMMMGKKMHHMGDQGAGLCGKLANNYLLAMTNLATAEAMSMGITWGLDAKALAGMINGSTGKCWPSEVNNPVPGVIETAPASRGYTGGFGISLMKKDLGLALTACEQFGVRTVMGEHVMKCYEEACADERTKGQDFSSVYKWLDGPVPEQEVKTDS